MSEQTAMIPFSDVKAMATAVAGSKLFKAFDTPERALVLMMVAQSEGSHPMQAVQRYDVIDGKPAKKSDAMLADFQARGGVVDWIRLTDTVVEASFVSPGVRNATTISWTIEMAKNAGLAGKNNWKGYPRAMLRARVISEGIRTVMPGVVAGLYTPEEVQDFDACQASAAVQNGSGKKGAIDVTATPSQSDPLAASCPANDVADNAPKASKEQVTALCTVMTKLGIKERGAVLTWINERIAPRAVESRLDLTSCEADELMGAAQELLDNQVKA